MSAQSKLQTMVGIIVALIVSGVLIGYVLPVGVDAIYDADTSEWGDAEIEIFELLPIFLVLVPLLVIVGWAIWAFRP